MQITNPSEQKLHEKYLTVLKRKAERDRKNETNVSHPRRGNMMCNYGGRRGKTGMFTVSTNVDILDTLVHLYDSIVHV